MMPLYEYQCKKCNHKFEKLVKLIDFDKPVTCEGCNKYVATRLVSSGIGCGSAGAEPWEYDEVHRMKPKFVRDSKGVRHKFNPAKHTKGRKGAG